MEYVDVNQISVINPINEAIQKTKDILFSPFNFNKWFIIGFCSWLAYLTIGGGYNFTRSFPSSPEKLSQKMREIPTWVTGGIIGLVILIAVLVIVIAFVCSWLRCRGQFMFIDCIVQNRGEVSLPWKTYKREGNNLFIFNLIAKFTVFLILVISVSISIAIAIPSIKAKTMGISVAIAFIVGFLLLFIIICLSGTFFLFLSDFVVPLMYLKKVTAKAAYKDFWGLCKQYSGKFALYVLFKILIVMATGTIIFLIAVIFFAVTCGMACCISAIPIVGALIVSFLIAQLVLPVRIFIMAYSLYFLRQFGESFNIWNKREDSVVIQTFFDKSV